MKKKLIESYRKELTDKRIPLAIYFSVFEEIEKEDEKNLRLINKDFNKSQKRYYTKKYISGNKFYKPISRSLDV